eukprot:m.464109 g.464109  ORF g.464109 m.464109 type:complete len:384 (-) comp23329_c0_seq1:89-1240(-)
MHHRPLVADAVRSLQHRRPAGATVQIDKSDSSLPFNLFDATRQNPDYHDRFTLTLVIDGVRAKWEVFFTGYEGATPPDFIFSSDPHFDPDLPSMTRWTDRPLSEALVSLFNELIDAYRAHIEKQIREHPVDSIRFAYQQCAGAQQRTTDYAVKCAILPRPDLPNRPEFQAVRFSLTLKTLYEKIPASPIRDSIQRNPVVVKVDFSPSSADQQTPKFGITTGILLVKEVANALGPMTTPLWEFETDIHSYTKLCETMLLDRIRSHTTAFVARKAYAAAFLAHFGSALLEVDLEDYRTLSFLFGVNDMYATVIISHPTEGPNFPETMPTISLLSTSVVTAGGSPVSITYKDTYPWSPRWLPDEMATRCRLFLLETIPVFSSKQAK